MCPDRTRLFSYVPAPGDGGVDDGDHVVQLGLEHAVEVGRAADGNESVGVGELGENAWYRS